MERFTIQNMSTDLYAPIIAAMLEIEFPGTAIDKCSTFEAVVKQIIGTKQHRNGPTPDPENLVAIRKAVRDAMDHHEPIPILVPWGGSKQGNGSVDIAELMALKQLVCLSDRIKQHYGHETDIRIRVEDATDNVLFANFPGWQGKTERYTNDFVKLADTIAPEIVVIKESSQVNFGGIGQLTNLFEQAIDDYGLHYLRELEAAGWQGGLDRTMVDYYRNAYERFYPDRTRAERERMIATYFACSLTRRQQGGTGFAPGEAPIVLCFANPVPGADQTRRVFYRTIPERYQHTHRAPWLGKGYVKIIGRDAQPAVAGWDGDGIPFVPNHATITRADQPATVQADYWVVE